MGNSLLTKLVSLLKADAQRPPHLRAKVLELLLAPSTVRPSRLRRGTASVNAVMLERQAPLCHVPGTFDSNADAIGVVVDLFHTMLSGMIRGLPSRLGDVAVTPGNRLS